MEQKYLFLIIGVLIGWVTKIPFLIKWYNELRKTRNYEEMKNENKYHEVMSRYLKNKYDITEQLLKERYEQENL